MSGEDFWTVVHQPFKAHELTRDDLAALIDRGLQHTRGSYRALLTTFGLPTSDYKRFHAFLYQQNCNLPVGPYRSAKAAIRGSPAPRFVLARIRVRRGGLQTARRYRQRGRRRLAPSRIS